MLLLQLLLLVGCVTVRLAKRLMACSGLRAKMADDRLPVGVKCTLDLTRKGFTSPFLN